jgi:hypothetical protein
MWLKIFLLDESMKIKVKTIRKNKILMKTMKSFFFLNSKESENCSLNDKLVGCGVCPYHI